MPVYLHLDVDVIDSAELPGLRFPSGPGPAVTQIEECLADRPGVARTHRSLSVQPGTRTLASRSHLPDGALPPGRAGREQPHLSGALYR